MKPKKLIYIGLTAVVALLILIFGINFLRGINLFHSSNYYFVTYESVVGLNVSAPVTCDGFKVGQVREMRYEYSDPGHVTCELALDKELKVPEGTVAVLTSDLLGTASVVLKMPKSTNYLPIGSKLEASQQAGLVDGLQENLLPQIAALMPQIDSLLNAVTLVVSDPALLAAVQRLDKITADLQTVSANAAVASKQLPGVVNHADQLVMNLNATSAKLDSVMATVNQMPLDRTMADVQQIAANLKALTEQLQDKDSSLGMLINDPGLYNSLNATVASLDSLIIDVKAQPKRYLKFSVF